MPGRAAALGHRILRALLLQLLCGGGTLCAAAGAQGEHFVTDEVAVAQLLELADQRLALMPAVAAAKWQTHSPVLDPERERAVVQRARELAAPLDLDPDAVGRFFELQVRIARDLQSDLHEKWRSHGFDLQQSPSMLTAQLRPQLDRLTHDLLLALYIAAPALRRDGFPVRYAALARQSLHSEGWADDNRRELLIALAVVRPLPGPALARIAAAGVLRIGTTGDYAPFSVASGDELSGADIDLATELARRLHARPVFVRTSWPSLLRDLDGGEFDLAVGGISVTAARDAAAAFSMPYASGGKTIISRCRDAARYSGLAAVDRPGVRLIVNPGGTNEQYVRANVHRAHVRRYADNRTIFDEISAERADVMITDDVEVELQTHRHSDLCRPYPGTLTHADKAILLRRDAELVKAVNGWLTEVVARGEPARLLQRYLDRASP